jgi:hypothetical protein
MQYQRILESRPWPYSLKSQYREEQYNSSLYDYHTPQGPHESFSTISPPTSNLSYETVQQLSSPQRDQNYTPIPHHPMSEKAQAPYRPSRGYGKIMFVQKPDQWGDYNQWTPEERHENRRIICFNKTTYGDIIQLDCFPVPINEYKESMHTISCIRWKPGPHPVEQHKLAGKCIFTSVDIITLLEKLVGYGFTVQEKNRIRRNLEGYHPETVKKEGNTNLVFNQVMAYTSPKVRNIEKDIKVFLWSDLTKALRKVVQKYNLRGGIAIGRPIAHPESSAQHSFLNDFSQQSSSETSQTQTSFPPGAMNIHNSSGIDPFTYSRQDLGYQLQGNSSSLPEMYFQSKEHLDNGHLHHSQISQLNVPMEFRGSMDEAESVEHEFTSYVHGIPGEFGS